MVERNRNSIQGCLLAILGLQCSTSFYLYLTFPMLRKTIFDAKVKIGFEETLWDQLYFLYDRFLYGQFLYSSIFIRSKFIRSDFIRSKFIQFKIYTVQNLYRSKFIQFKIYMVNFYTVQFLYGQNLYSRILYGQNLYSSKFIQVKIYTGQNLYSSKFIRSIFIQYKFYTVTKASSLEFYALW
jgi:hypothetical protein